MPDNRELRKRIRNRRQSTRIATAAIRTAVGELTLPDQARVKAKGLGTTRAVVKTGVDALALATQPAITFAAKPSGKLATTDVLATARHEVGHFSLPGGSKGKFPTPSETDTQHFNLKAAGATGLSLSVQSGTQLRQAANVSRLSFEQKVSRARKFKNVQTKSQGARRTSPSPISSTPSTPRPKRIRPPSK